MGLLGTQSISEATILDVNKELGIELTGKGTLIGFIDTGIDYTNKVFLNPDGSSKIKYIWDQGIKGNGPDGYYFGTEYNELQINNALKAENPYEIIPHQDSVRSWNFLSFCCMPEEEKENL